MEYYINVRTKKRNTAGAKASDDVAELCRQRGMKSFEMPLFPQKTNKLFEKIWLLFVCTYYWSKLKLLVQEGDIVFYQHPMYGNRVSEKYVPNIQKTKKCKFIALIHDLESLRNGIQGVIKNNPQTNLIADNMLLKHFDYVICHNQFMKQYLITQGFHVSKIISLEIFDYLSDCHRIPSGKGDRPSIAFAGNLAMGKSGYIYKIFGENNDKNHALQVHLYGNHYETINDDRMIYHGSFLPEILPEYLTGDFGLVWDGISAETCAGNTGEYLKYNNPHKTSLYLSAGLPVIVWRQAAIADFVLVNKVGIVVDSLYDLEQIIEAVSAEDYAILSRNAEVIGQRLKNGYYFLKAITEAENNLASTNKKQ